MNWIIIYGSHYGTTRKYALKLAEMTNIPAISFESVKDINSYNNIIYFGGIYAGGILGMSKTFKRLKNLSDKKLIIVTVGLSNPEEKENIKNIRDNIERQLSGEIIARAKIFHLRGGIDYNELGFIHRNMMRLLYNSVKNLPDEKKSAEDRAVIETYNQKVDFIDFSGLKDIIAEIRD